ncbi:MAG: TFIIB-type zinc ribbon-containing protein [Planctomycetota bacterium]|jgi:hypothetical protein
MIAKIVGISILLTTPFSASMWWASHSHPHHRRMDVTQFKSLRVVLGEGVCHLHLLDMPTRSVLNSKFSSKLKTNVMLPPQSLQFSTYRDGPYHITMLTFPLWASTMLLVSAGMMLLLTGPMLRWHRIWKGWCESCGYDLRGSKSGRCPECGGRFHRKKPRAARKPVRRRTSVSHAGRIS